MKRQLKLVLGNRKLMFQIFFTLFIISIVCLGTSWPLPFINTKSLDLSKLFGVFSINAGTLFGLGITPYITASIVVQFLQKLLPICREWKDQGQMGKRKLNLLTRSLALLFAFGQSFAFLNSYSKLFVTSISTSQLFLLALIATAGVAILIWFADLINSKGIGNGTSILIVVSMSHSLINLFVNLNESYLSQKNFLTLKTFNFACIVLLLLLFLIFTVVVQITSLKIPINYARNQVQGKSYIPLKINSAGVMPVILASALLQPFQMLSGVIGNTKFTEVVDFFAKTNFPGNQINFFAIGFLVLLVIVFSFFSAFMNVNPEDISEHLSKQDAYIAGLRPGEQTTRYLANTLFKITVLGTVFIAALVVTPILMEHFLGLKDMKLGGTSLLIIVSVALETIQRIKATANKKEYQKLF
ncbi:MULTISPECIES: preprotein translocase subunit SecY [Candidatus Phytoplasma]|uniref:Protein translocase subunit SecY n=4 Tax=16SrI (Aster yellows group) TaxID=3042590 RepID=A0A4P6ME66_9MOLU|nr:MULTISPECIES: preprotein translocase subunit SecY [Phytoplasma]AGY36787.1 preprotein translocase subunit [Carrot yellows phytoplasma]AHW80363.1 preprotein translocase subunit ['Juncus articulatus' phytoplasma]AHW80365.1 preprotein translocase subunit ['Juncus articulatus' phytoplasma (ex Livia junci)]AHW80364.1 preprotein translocase subunit ['Juncus articulatus' phytoplasma]OIJ44832.1 preprotein translocase subunit SecY [Rice orange leaf phytoplasma]